MVTGVVSSTVGDIRSRVLLSLSSWPTLSPTHVYASGQETEAKKKLERPPGRSTMRAADGQASGEHAGLDDEPGEFAGARPQGGVE